MGIFDIGGGSNLPKDSFPSRKGKSATTPGASSEIKRIIGGLTYDQAKAFFEAVEGNLKPLGYDFVRTDNGITFQGSVNGSMNYHPGESQPGYVTVDAKVGLLGVGNMSRTQAETNLATIVDSCAQPYQKK